MGGVRTAALLAQRLTAKMHRELLAWGWHGTPGLCGPYFLPVMDKTAYKTQLTYPIATTDKDGGKLLPALRPHHRRLGRRQGVPGPRRGLRLHAVPQEELLCGLLTVPPGPHAASHAGSVACCRARGARPAQPAASSPRPTSRAPRVQPTITDQDIERARQQAPHAHRRRTGPRAGAGGADASTPCPSRRPSSPSTWRRSPRASMRQADAGARRRRIAQARACWSSSASPCPRPRSPGCVDQAARARATLVLRGLVDGSLRDTVDARAAPDRQRQVAVQIDPQAFDRFSIAAHADLRAGAATAPSPRPAPPARASPATVRAGRRRRQPRLRARVLPAFGARVGRDASRLPAAHEGRRSMNVRRRLVVWFTTRLLRDDADRSARPVRTRKASPPARPPTRWRAAASPPPAPPRSCPATRPRRRRRAYYRQPNLAAPGQRHAGRCARRRRTTRSARRSAARSPRPTRPARRLADDPAVAAARASRRSPSSDARQPGRVLQRLHHHR